MKLFKNGLYLLGLSLLCLTTSCNDDDDISNIIGGLDFVIATLSAEGNEIGVVPSTVPGDNRVVYTVDFGDPAGSPEEVVVETSGPMVRYIYPEETATYTIMVTASLPGRDDVSITKEHTVIFATEPPPGGDPIVGTWRLAPEAGAFGVGPALGDTSFFANSAEDVIIRDCLFDDAYVFGSDGTFQNVLGSETWLEAWQGVATEQCGAPVAPHDGTVDATYSYNPSGSLTLTGTGAYMGLAKVVNGSELAAPSEAPDSITYIAELSADGNTMDLDIEVGGGVFWSFKFVKDAPPEPSELDGTWRIAPEAGAFGVGPALGDQSFFANTLDDVTTRDCFFDDEYVFSSDGTFQNLLGSETWLEGWQGVSEDQCGAPVAPHDGSAAATYAYDASGGTLTLTGVGAYMGLAKVVNGSELASPSEAPESITYLAELSEDGNTLNLDIEVGGGVYWSFKFVKDVVPTGIQGTWIMAPEAGAFGVGPALGDQSFFANSAADVTTRDCYFDDEYVFEADGTFQNILGSETWLEGWQGVSEDQCGAPVAPHDGSANATYTYDASGGTLTITGVGAYMGLAKVVNGSELTSPSEAPDSITYLAEISDDGSTLDLDIEVGGGVYWSYKFIRQ